MARKKKIPLLPELCRQQNYGNFWWCMNGNTICGCSSDESQGDSGSVGFYLLWFVLETPMDHKKWGLKEVTMEKKTVHQLFQTRRPVV